MRKEKNKKGRRADRLEPRPGGIQGSGDAALADRIHLLPPRRQAARAYHPQPS